MINAVLYIHGKDGNAAEADHYKELFPFCDVFGLDYKNDTPWAAGDEIREAARSLSVKYENVILVANSIGAFLSMHADIEKEIAHAYFISPIVDMESLIIDMMRRVKVTESELREKGVIKNDFGEELSWEYLCYIRNNPILWNVPTDILYGSEDVMTSIDIVTTFAEKHNGRLTVMDGGGHWFHTEAQMRFLDTWIRKTIGCREDYR